MGMTSGEDKVDGWVDEKSLSEKKMKGEEGEAEEEEESTPTGCWIKLRFIGSCISSRSKVDTSITGTATNDVENKLVNNASVDQPATVVVSSTTTSNAESSTSTSKYVEELKVSSRLRKFTFNDLKVATRNFRPESLLGEVGLGVYSRGGLKKMELLLQNQELGLLLQSKP